MAYQLIEHRGEIWVRGPLDDHWTCAFRLFQEAGHIVVGEMRLFPLEREWRPGSGHPASWSEDDARIPVGGLTARKTRQIRFDELRRFVGAALNHLQQRRQDAFVADVLARVPTLDTTPSTRRGGRKPLPLEEYAALAARYVAKCEAGVRDPIAELARETNYQTSRVKWALRKARSEGLLTPTLRGRAGGSLTKKAISILNEQEADNAS